MKDIKKVSRAERTKAIAELVAFRPKQALGGLSIRAMIEEGRRGRPSRPAHGHTKDEAVRHALGSLGIPLISP